MVPPLWFFLESVSRGLLPWGFPKAALLSQLNMLSLTETEDIKKRWQEYTEELYKKDLHDPDNHDGVITDLEPDILECEVKWALEVGRAHV